MKRIYQINDMHCSNCSMLLEGIEDELPGIRSIAASYQKGRLVVEFDESKTSSEKIIAAVRGKGYTVVSDQPA